MQGRALRLKSSFQTWLDKYNEFSLHQKNLQTLMIEIHRIINQFDQFPKFQCQGIQDAPLTSP